MRVEYGTMLTVSRVMFIFVGNESFNIWDNRKMVLLSHTFTFILKIQVWTVAAVMPTCKPICF